MEVDESINPMLMAMSIPLITDLICWHAVNKWNVQTIRLVSRQFNQGVMRGFAAMKKQVVIDRNVTLDRFIFRMDSRIQHQFPFSNYQLHLQALVLNKVRRFSSALGEFVSILDLKGPLDVPWNHNTKLQILIVLRNVPNLVSLRILTKDELFMDTAEVATFPAVFPKLTHVEVLYNRQRRFLDMLEDEVRLGTLLVARSPLIIQYTVPILERELLYVGYQPPFIHSHFPIPHVEVLKELMDMECWKTSPSPKYIHLPEIILSERSFRIYQDLFVLNPNLIKTRVIIQTNWDARYSLALTPFLADNYSTLKKLSICIDAGNFQPNVITTRIIVLPPLPKLCSLNIDFGTQVHDDGTPFFHLLSFTHIQFRSLKKLCLKNYNEKHKVALKGVGVVFPKLTELEFILPIGPFMEPWGRMAPNLTSLKLHLNTAEHLMHLESKVYYVLKNFCKLTHLELLFDGGAILGSMPNIWNALTGYLPCERQSSTSEESAGCSNPVSHPSLNSLKALKELHLIGLGRENILAIVRMTEEGLLRPLSTIIIKEHCNADVPQEFIDFAVRSLRRVHSEVTLKWIAPPPVLNPVDQVNVYDH